MESAHVLLIRETKSKNNQKNTLLKDISHNEIKSVVSIFDLKSY